MKGCDIAWQKPSGSALRAAGFTVASLYVGQDNTGKNMTQAVVDDYNANGVGVVVNFEYGAQQMANGAPQGTVDARLGLSQKRAIGIPDSIPIYYSADWAATSAQIQGGVIPYLVAARDVTGPGTVGVYGSYYTVSQVADYWAAHFPGEKVWLWQTVAWSNGNIHAGLDMYQDGTTSTVAGIQVDNDFVFNANVGQYPAPAEQSSTQEEDMPWIYAVEADPANPTKNQGEWYSDGPVLYNISPDAANAYTAAGVKSVSIPFGDFERLRTSLAVQVDSNAIATAVAGAVSQALAGSVKFPTSFTGTLT